MASRALSEPLANQLETLLVTYPVRILFIAALMATVSTLAQDKPASSSLNAILGKIRSLEGANEPKCYATASRLEDFINGTPLTDSGRFRKNELQKELVQFLWRNASMLAREDGRNELQIHDVEAVTSRLLRFEPLPNGDWKASTAAGILTVNSTDKRQYSSIAYSLRAVLAAQQDLLHVSEVELPALENDALAAIKEFVELYTLAALQLADRKARLLNRPSINDDDIQNVWNSLSSADIAMPAINARQVAPTDFQVLNGIIRQKLASYEEYNQVSNVIFLRNLQVYFARVPWPKEAKAGNAIKAYFNQTLVNFATDLYLGSEQLATKKGQALIREADVSLYSHYFIPHQVNEYEDVLFFPDLSNRERITIESYDMDAFRDSGGHWRYLQFALESPSFSGRLEADPFAAELLAENMAQFGVLVLRVAGDIAKQQGASTLATNHIEKGLALIQERISAHALVANGGENELDALESAIQSSKNSQEASGDDPLFTEATSDVGIRVEHRTADWLSRLLRSYLPSGENVGNITIPPAFGGSGVAAEDINDDGYPDVLILSGRGNRLYLNDRNGGFQDFTAESGLDWRREQDNQPGEPRQPVIADFDNDGLQDILITYVNDKHRLYKNVGGARFEDITDQVNLGGEGLVGGPATAFDFDRDGLLDIYITYFGNYVAGILPTLKRRNFNGTPNQLFRNIGGMKFINVTTQAGVGDSGWAQAVTHTDFNVDGWQDLIVGNDFGVNVYYKNLGNGTFQNVASELGVDKPSYTMGIGLSDLNRDGYPDVYISNIVTMNKDEKYVLPNEDTVAKFDPEKLANLRVIEANDLFISAPKSDGKKYRQSEAVGRGYSSTGWSWGADFGDFDNDGDDDLYVLNGMNEFAIYSSENAYYVDPTGANNPNVYVPVSDKESNVFFLNEGGKLNNASKGSGIDLLGNSRSAAYLDYDRDGDLDVLVNNYHGPAVFYKNNTQLLGGNWLSLKLKGDPEQGSNLDAVGAQVTFTTPDGATIWREIHSSVAYMTGHPKEIHVGLGDHTSAQASIVWPNGESSLIEGLKANASHVIEQSEPGRVSLFQPGKQ